MVVYRSITTFGLLGCEAVERDRAADKDTIGRPWEDMKRRDAEVDSKRDTDAMDIMVDIKSSIVKRSNCWCSSKYYAPSISVLCRSEVKDRPLMVM